MDILYRKAAPFANIASPLFSDNAPSFFVQNIAFYRSLRYNVYCIFMNIFRLLSTALRDSRQ